MFWDDWAIDTNAQMTVVQVIPVFLIAALVEIIVMPTRMSRARWLLIVSVINTAVLLISVAMFELIGILAIGSGRTFRGEKAFWWIVDTAAVMFLAFLAITFSVITKSVDRRRERARVLRAEAVDRRRRLSSRASRAR